ncbi:molybdopterin cofactor-binding domain-containing protein [Micromonospora chokoriensis]
MGTHSQLMGGMLWGLGQALLETTRVDPRLGRWANASLGYYLVAVNADAPDAVVDTVEVQGGEPARDEGRRGDRCGRCGRRDRNAGRRRQYEPPIMLEKLL